MRPGEQPPLGLILYADKSEEQIELLQLTKGGIRVASYRVGNLLEDKADQVQQAKRLVRLGYRLRLGHRLD